MFFIIRALIISATLVFLIACQKPVPKKERVSVQQKSARAEIPEKYRKFIDQIRPFFKKMDEPEPFDWLSNFHEDGQTFAEYINSEPTLPTEKRRKIYIQPLGKFQSDELRLIKLTDEFIGIFYNLPTEKLKTKDFEYPLSLKNQRTNPTSKIKQIRTGYILDELLKPALPADAAALICFTTEDLYPKDDFNYVFGQASLVNRVGVWSLYRLEAKGDFELFLRRILKIAVHETGHMFSISHCTAFSCAMNGSNHLAESDRRPLDFCPEDTAKILWMTDTDVAVRYLSLAKFCERNGLIEEAKIFRNKYNSVRVKV